MQFCPGALAVHCKLYLCMKSTLIPATFVSCVVVLLGLKLKVYLPSQGGFDRMCSPQLNQPTLSPLHGSNRSSMS